MNSNTALANIKDIIFATHCRGTDLSFGIAEFNNVILSKIDNEIIAVTALIFDNATCTVEIAGRIYGIITLASVYEIVPTNEAYNIVALATNESIIVRVGNESDRRFVGTLRGISNRDRLICRSAKVNGCTIGSRNIEDFLTIDLTGLIAAAVNNRDLLWSNLSASF